MSYWECLLFLLAISLVSQHEVEGRKVASTKDLELEKHLKRLNKPAVKTIHSADGDIIDCVDIYRQPAFDHPALKNHTIKMRPSSYPKWLEEEENNDDVDGDSVNALSQVWRDSGSCPEGTIPIRRVQKSDLLRATSPENFGKKYPYHFHSNSSSANINAPNRAKYTFATMRVWGAYHGGSAKLNVWNPQVESRRDFTSIQLWLTNGPDRDVNVMEAGWTVNPTFYGDNRTRMFIYWTADGFRKTGCFNLHCAGFVQTTSEVALGAAIQHTSTYTGHQYLFFLLILKDPIDGNWWLIFLGGGIEIHLGYWPGQIFTHLAKHASKVEWGGEVFSDRIGGPHTTTQMGSGHLASEEFGRACFVKDIRVLDVNNVAYVPDGVRSYVPQPNCYGIFDAGKSRGYRTFYVGGPGRNPNCP